MQLFTNGLALLEKMRFIFYPLFFKWEYPYLLLPSIQVCFYIRKTTVLQKWQILKVNKGKNYNIVNKDI